MKHDASGAEAHVRFIKKVMLVQRCANKTQLKLKVRENEKISVSCWQYFSLCAIFCISSIFLKIILWLM